jgi:prepilin-type N-terminal cleavage/methylation domain-containing protein
MMKRRLLRGLTLIEALVAIAIIAILAGLAAPPFRESLAKARLEGAVSTFAIDVHQMVAAGQHGGHKRADASKPAARLEIDSSGTSYKIWVFPTPDANPNPLKEVALPDGVSFTAKKFEVDGLRGTIIAPQTVEAKSTQTDIEFKMSTNALGRVSLCSSKRAVAGYVAC